MESVFRFFDRSGHGTITSAEFKKGCDLLNKTLPEGSQITDIDKVMRAMDIADDGEVDINEFFEMFRICDIQYHISTAEGQRKLNLSFHPSHTHESAANIDASSKSPRESLTAAAAAAAGGSSSSSSTDKGKAAAAAAAEHDMNRLQRSASVHLWNIDIDTPVKKNIDGSTKIATDGANGDQSLHPARSSLKQQQRRPSVKHTTTTTTQNPEVVTSDAVSVTLDGEEAAPMTPSKLKTFETLKEAHEEITTKTSLSAATWF